MTLGLLVLAGIVAFMVALGFVLHQVSRAVADILDWLLPLMYGAVFALGVATILGLSPFAGSSARKRPCCAVRPPPPFCMGCFWRR